MTNLLVDSQRIDIAQELRFIPDHEKNQKSANVKNSYYATTSCPERRSDD